MLFIKCYWTEVDYLGYTLILIITFIHFPNYSIYRSSTPLTLGRNKRVCVYTAKTGSRRCILLRPTRRGIQERKRCNPWNMQVLDINKHAGRISKVRLLSVNPLCRWEIRRQKQRRGINICCLPTQTVPPHGPFLFHVLSSKDELVCLLVSSTQTISILIEECSMLHGNFP